MTYTAYYSSPLGKMLLAEREGALTGLWFEGQKYFFPGAADGAEERETPLLRETQAWLDRYFAGERPDPGELPIVPEGGAFRQLIWRLLLDIPYGETATYALLAGRAASALGRERMSAQAVGGAVGHNPISIIIPCHRVVGASGSLTGYAGGLERKRRLLAHEGADLERLFMPKKTTAP